MNETLEKLANAYIDGGTGSIMLYYDMQTTGFQTGAGSDYSASLDFVSTSFTGGIVDSSSMEFLRIYSGGSAVGFYTFDTPGVTITDIEDGLDPSDNYGITVQTPDDGNTLVISSIYTGIESGLVWGNDGLNDFIVDSSDFLPSISYSGYVKNVSPSSTVGSHDGFLIRDDYSSISYMNSFVKNEVSGVDLTFSNFDFNDFESEGFMSTGDLNSSFSFLFSSKKINNTNGVLFGNLNRFQYSDSNNDFTYGKGFNIGINDRNKLFFQGIDSVIGEYVLTANELELADKNICSASVSPYSVRFSVYNLTDDEFQEQSLRTDSKIEHNDWGQRFTIGGSPTYLRAGQTYSGCLDEFLIISGNHPSSDLKSIASGFVATGSPISGASFQDEFVTGHEISLITPVGVTGYELVATGYQEVLTNSDFIEFVLVENPTPYSRNDGERFITGYSLPNNSGSYLEETSFLIPENDYNPTGDDAFATLGLVDSGDVVTRYTIQTTRVVTLTSGVTLYDVSPITGILLGEPTGYQKTDLTTTLDKTGSLVENLVFKDGYMENYKYDYLHFLERRI